MTNHKMANGRLIKKSYFQDLLDKMLENLASFTWRMIVTWYKNIPPITKLLISVPFLFAIASDLEVVNESDFNLNWNRVKSNYEVWRLFTPYICFGTVSFDFSQYLLWFYAHSAPYEAKPYNTGAGGTSADFLWLIVLAIICIDIVAVLSPNIIVAPPLSLFYLVIYVYGRRMTSSFTIFGFQIVPKYFPMIRIAYDLIYILGSGANMLPSALLGIALGHAYYLCIEELPAKLNRRIVYTPAWCSKVMSLYASSQVTVIRNGVPAMATQQQPIAHFISPSATAAVPVAQGVVISVGPSAPSLSLMPSSPSSLPLHAHVSSSSVVMQGWLWKQSIWIKAWRKRYVIIDNNNFLHYKGEHSKSKSVSILLDNCRSVKVGRPYQQRMVCLVICSPSLRDITLRANSEQECKAWIKAISNAIPLSSDNLRD